MTISRRTFLGGCASVCFLNGVQLSVSRQAWANTGEPHTLIYVFLRGGIDGLNFVCPTEGEARGHYEGYRKNIAVPRIGATNGALSLANGWGFNPSAASLKEVWQDKNLAIIHACGMPEGFSTRSHFDAQKYLERGITANASTSTVTGWLGRYLNGVPTDNDILPAVSSGMSGTESLVGFLDSVSVNSLEGFDPVSGANEFRKNYYRMIANTYRGSDALDLSVNASLELVKTLSSIDPDAYAAPKDVKYPAYDNGRLKGISNDFRRVAKLLRTNPDLGVHAATINVGGWDTHNRQGDDGQGGYGAKLKDLADAVSAFYQEMEVVGLGKRYTMIIQSEFGRRVRENEDKGTDHGTGNPLFVIGDKVKGGKLYGRAPTLRSSELFQSEDVPVTTDYRKVIREILGKGLKVDTAGLAKILPNYRDRAVLNLMNGKIVEGQQDGVIFSDGFEK